MTCDPWIVVSHVIVEEGQGFYTLVSQRYEGDRCIEVRRAIPAAPRRRGFVGTTIDNARRRWSEWKERRAVKRGDQSIDVFERLKQLKARARR